MAHLGPHLYYEETPDENIIEGATELFEIDDFTSPSPWEKFVSQLESIIREWNLHKNTNDNTCPLPSWPWRARSRNLNFYDFEFLVTEYSRYDPEKKSDENLDDIEVEEIEHSR